MPLKSKPVQMLEITASRNVYFMGTIKGLHLGWVSRRYRHMNKNLKLPNLEHLRSFHHVCTSGSIGAAVKNTGVPRATLSRHIASIEADLSSILFTRGSEGFIITQLGETVFEYANDILKTAENLSEAVISKNSELTGPIKIVASSGIATIILPSILANINSEIKGLQLELVSADSVSMDSKQDADIAIQTYRPLRKDLIASKLGEINCGVYASAKYLEKNGIPQSIQDLENHCLIGTIPETLKQKVKGFGGQAILNHSNVIQCENYPLSWQLVMAGCGIGMTHRLEGDAEPSVKLILEEMGTLNLPVWLVAQPDLKKRARIHMVYKALAKQMRRKLKYYQK